MKIGRNDKCPCNSGRKYKKCCVGLPKVPIKKLNNDISRKYMTEFALHTYSSNIAISSAKDLDKLDESEANYHIYMINKIPRLSFVENSLKVYESHIEVSVQKLGNDKEIYDFSLSLEKEIKAELKGTKYLTIKNNEGEIYDLDVVSFYRSYSRDYLQLEVLYIGQSYGINGSRDAFKRLRQHSTFQKILVDMMHEDTEHEIVITLWDFTPRLVMSIDGTSTFTANKEENKKHTENVYNNPPIVLDDHIINATEASLINYFKPHYNQKFKNNFPDINHMGYRYYYDYDFNEIIVELDTITPRIDIWTDHTSYDWRKHIKFNLHSEESRKSIFNI